MKKRLVLFDVDGTLLSSGPLARDVFAAALVDVFGTCGDILAYRFEGKMDPIIVRELMCGAGLDEGTIAARCGEALDLYLDRLEVVLAQKGPALKPGVKELVEEVDGTPHAVNALLTGNVERGARIKLQAAGLWDRFRFGVFGDEAPRRVDLGPVALRRALELTDVPFGGESTVIVGDARADVECGKAIGARVVAVATGRTTAEELHAAGADVVFEDFSDLAASKEAILE